MARALCAPVSSSCATPAPNKYRDVFVDNAEQTEQTRRYFDKIASGWAARYSGAAFDGRKARFFAAVQAHYPQPADILDFGCGSGDIALHLASAGHRLTGYDISPAMIAQANQADRDHVVRWVSRAAGASNALPFADASFDVVVTSSVLEYVPHPHAALNEIARVLRPGGWLFATVPDIRHPMRRRERWLQCALTIPGIASLLSRSRSRSRWSNYATYLLVSTSRMEPQTWQSLLSASDFRLQEMPPPTDPLILLAASKA